MSFKARIALLNDKIAATQSQATVALNLIALYKAFGGGWKMVEPEKDADKPLSSSGGN